MPSPDTANISTGPGLIYYAPLATAEPASRIAAWPSGWVPVGYTAEGHSFTSGINIDNVEVAELLQPVKRVVTSVDDHIAFALAEITLAHLKLVRNGGTITADSQIITDAATTNASPTLTSASAAFTSADIGVAVTGAGIPAGATITAVTNATTVTLSANATATASGVTVTLVGRIGSYYEPPEVGAEIRHMIGWDSEDGSERLVIRRVIQVGNGEIARRKGADFARFNADFALEQPGGGVRPWREYASRSRVAA